MALSSLKMGFLLTFLAAQLTGFADRHNRWAPQGAQNLMPDIRPHDDAGNLFDLIFSSISPI